MATLEQTLATVRANTNETLAELSAEHPVLVVFLRHFGCPFCREAASDIQKQRADIERSGVRVVLVHQGTEDQAAGWFAARGLSDLRRVADPERALYRAFELKRGNPWQLFGPKVWWRAIQALIQGNLIGKAVAGDLGDAFQMQGAFLIHNARIIHAYRHRSQADRPDYRRLSRVPEAPTG